MNISINGEYTIKTDKQVLVHQENLITSMGESFFLNRWINNELPVITSIVLGKGTSRPLKSDTELGIPIISKICNKTVDLKNKKIVLSCDCNASEIIGTSEIGVTNGEVLISHDIYESITSEILENDNTSTVHIEYSFNITTATTRSNWTLSQTGENIYYIYEPNTVIGVSENTVGYVRKNNIESLSNGSFYYDSGSKNLYIKSIAGTDPNQNEIVVVIK